MTAKRLLQKASLITLISGATAIALSSCDAMMDPTMSMGVNVGPGGVIPFTNVGAIFNPLPPSHPFIGSPDYWGVNFVPPHDPGGGYDPGLNGPFLGGGPGPVRPPMNTPANPPAAPGRPVVPANPPQNPGPAVTPPPNNPQPSPTRPGGRVPASNATEVGPTLGNTPGMIVNGQNRPLPGRY